MIVYLLTGPVDPNSIIDKLIPSGIWPFIIQLLSTLVMLLIVKRFLYQPIKNILDARATYVKTHMDEALSAEEKAKKLLAKLEKDAKNAKQELQLLREQAQEEIDTNRQQLLSEAQLQAQAIRQKASEEIILAKEQALQQIEKEMINVALSATAKLLKREVTGKDNDQLIEDFIKGIRH
jgi:F-type H+-transporting ATPase subunit b